ncbi:ABC-type amino acid transport system, permease component [Devosia sp. LC5]|jgi:polar amino acid transport system permease protein|uniref:amino acid ABC transporter permease n=1 Tax=Devosia sp. LC5 TaxID=1502724 RepID=UPI0004E31CC9|nr:amino acid ABC transporter permease [Devosia sp. LC5]KFC70256.1 ABC-type amino acid transport system, permease component [Devosia sp. LC5]
MTSFNLMHLQFILTGAMWTVILSVLATLGGGIGGAILALAGISRHRFIRNIAALYITLIQGVPLLVILFLTYFGLPALGFNIEPLAAATFGLSVYVSAFLGEIWRGSLEAVRKAQWEAGECLALTRMQVLLHIIMPQSIRLATPPTVGFIVQVVKNTSLVSAISFIELTRSGQIVNNSTFQPFLIYTIVACLYFAMCFPLSRFSRVLEKKFAISAR